MPAKCVAGKLPSASRCVRPCSSLKTLRMISSCELPAFGGRYPVLGAWIIAGQPAGLGIREDATPITRDTSRFVPHLFD